MLYLENKTLPGKVAHALMRAASRLVSTRGPGRRHGTHECVRHTLFALCFSAAAFAASTRTWSETDYAEFEKGNLKNLSLRSDGVLTLAPKFQELYDSSSAYLWTLARDSKGNLYTGGGPGAKL